MSYLSIINARIIDPASGYDCEGTVLIQDGVIIEFGPDVIVQGEIIDAQGLICAPGLIDCLLYTSPSPRD